MYRIITASSDTYITNKIINNRFRATDANVGQAGTLDLFKLYNESTLQGETKPMELSRLLIKFNHEKIKEMHDNGTIDVGDPSFKALLKLHDVYGGETTPSNFKCIVFPLTRKFDEGTGYDIGNYSDLGATNYITASYSNGIVNPWILPGGFKSGSLQDASSIDVITSGTIAGQDTAITLCAEQLFLTGEEDLEVDITNFVSASVKGLIDNHGHLIALSGSHEKDVKSYFVKRFSSRNTSNTSKIPKMIIKFDESLVDNHENFIFNNSGSLYLTNHVRGELKNIRFGDQEGDLLSGEDCMILKIVTGSFKKIFNVSQVPRGSGRITGTYSSSFSISSFGDLYQDVLTSGSIVFDEIWSSSDESLTFLSSSLKIKKADLNALDQNQTRYHVIITNLSDRYRSGEVARVRVFVENNKRDVVLRKTPFEKKSEVFDKMFYRVRDFVSGDVIIPFGKSDNSTRLSADSTGMYFDFYTDSLPAGRTFIFEFLIQQGGFDNIVSDAPTKFVVE